MTDKGMTRRDFMTVLAGSFGTALLAGCAGSKDQGTTDSGTAAADYEVDYGTSELYTQADMDAAIELILAEFNRWNGCTMKRIAFTDDKTCTDDVAYVNTLRKDGTPEFDQAIVFKTDFHSPSEKEAEGTAWEPDTDYTDYEWHFGRTGSDGEWQFLTCGY